MDHDGLVRYLEPLFESLPAATEDPVRMAPSGHFGVSCHPKDLEQVHLCLGGDGPHLSSDLRFAGAVLNTILGGNMSSRLFQEIREKRGLAYSVFSSLSSYADTGILKICAGTTPDKGRDVLGVTGEILADLAATMLLRERFSLAAVGDLADAASLSF